MKETNQTTTLPTIDLPRHRFGEYNFVRIWGHRTDIRHPYTQDHVLSCSATNNNTLKINWSITCLLLIGLIGCSSFDVFSNANINSGSNWFKLVTHGIAQSDGLDWQWICNTLCKQKYIDQTYKKSSSIRIPDNTDGHESWPCLDTAEDLWETSTNCTAELVTTGQSRVG